MKSLRVSVTTFVLLGLICVINGNLITNLLGKSDDKAETDDKNSATTTSTIKPAEGPAAAAKAGVSAGAGAIGVPPTAAPAAAAAGTTSTADPGSSCGGLKGFLHICDKSEPTEPPKNVKTRSVDDDDDDDDDNDDDDSSSEETSHELKEMKRKKKAEEKEAVVDNDNDEVDNAEEVSSTSEPTFTTESQNVQKREAEGDDEKEEEEPRTEKLDDYPFESPVFAMLKKRSAEETNHEDSKPMNGTEGTADQEEMVEGERRRRDCGDGGKDCRRKRELVPCVEPRCARRQQELENE